MGRIGEMGTSQAQISAKFGHDGMRGPKLPDCRQYARMTLRTNDQRAIMCRFIGAAMKLKLDAATSQRRDDVIHIVIAAFALIVCEFALVKWIFVRPGNQRDLIDCGYVLILPVPFLLGLHLRRRVKNLRSTEDLSVRASAEINSDVSSLMATTYILLLGLWVVHSLVK